MPVARVGDVLLRSWREDSWDGMIVGEVAVQDHYQIEDVLEYGEDFRYIVDVGAHIGAFALYAQHLWPGCRVTCYEATTANYAHLIANTAHLPNVLALNLALLGYDVGDIADDASGGRSDGSGWGTVRMSMTDMLANTGGSYVNGGDLNPEANGGARVRAVPAENIFQTRWSESDDRDVDFLKMDCEGSEVPILERLAASDLLRRVRWAAGEYHIGRGYDDVVARIAAALGATHDVLTEPRTDDDNLGFFLARRREVHDDDAG